jgi:hypothetical protein
MNQCRFSMPIEAHFTSSVQMRELRTLTGVGQGSPYRWGLASARQRHINGRCGLMLHRLLLDPGELLLLLVTQQPR